MEFIKSDSVHGAEFLTRRSIGLVRLVATDKRIRDARTLTAVASDVYKQIARCQPAMTSIQSLVMTVLAALEESRTLADLRMLILRAVDQVDRASTDHVRAIAGLATHVIHPGDTIITHSNSSTVLQALLEAKKTRRRLAVVCTESRPMLEGVDLARRLGKAGLNVELVTDAGVFAKIGQANVILLGADSIGADYLVNKIGSLGIALAALHHRVPCYALASSLKLSFRRNPATSREGKASEILQRPSPHVKPVNHYFDVTPLDLLTGIITESGILTPRGVSRLLSKYPAHPKLP